MTPSTASTPKEARDEFRSVMPLGHFLRPSDFSGVVVFLASAASDTITGQNIINDGGFGLNALTTGFRVRERQAPPRVSLEAELTELKQDFDAMGVVYDTDGFQVT